MSRLGRIRGEIDRAELDALLVTDPINRRYASGFTGSRGWLLIGPRIAVIATDFRYWEQAAEEAPEFELVRISGKIENWWGEFTARVRDRTVGYEAGHMTMAGLEALHAANNEISAPPVFEAASGIFTPLRAMKDEAEIAAIRRAAALTDDALAHALSLAQPDWTERRLAWEIEAYARSNGAEAMAFDSIVAAGPWGARPHASPRDEPLGEGRPIVIDIGARVDGYCSDMTRTVVLGESDGTFRTVHDIVLAAQETAAEMIEPGMTCADAHELAHRVIREAGYGEQFGHGLGHGVGLQIHEHPYIGTSSDDSIAEGQVITIEPGIYLPEWGGVRIEDMGLIADGRFESFSGAPKQRMIGSGT